MVAQAFLPVVGQTFLSVHPAQWGRSTDKNVCATSKSTMQGGNPAPQLGELKTKNCRGPKKTHYPGGNPAPPLGGPGGKYPGRGGGRHPPAVAAVVPDIPSARRPLLLPREPPCVFAAPFSPPLASCR